MGAVYDRIGVGYAELRRPDPRVAAALLDALGDAQTVVNVGAGAGSYEPPGAVAVEPSRVMIDQRHDRRHAVQARAEQLPFADGTFDAALAVLTTHHWSDGPRGLAEMARVSQRQVVLTWDQAAFPEFWLVRDYLPEVVAAEAGMPALAAAVVQWPDAEVRVLPVPWDCTDGFLAAYWRRPEAYLRPAVRAAISSFSWLAPDLVDAAMARLAADLESGEWVRRNAELLELDELDCSYRLVVRG
jgi:SAM-dependent methyltransferase